MPDCIHCGALVASDATFCHSCGSKLGPEAEDAGGWTAPGSVSQPEAEPEASEEPLTEEPATPWTPSKASWGLEPTPERTPEPTQEEPGTWTPPPQSTWGAEPAPAAPPPVLVEPVPARLPPLPPPRPAAENRPVHVPNYLVGSILTALCCCQVTGVVAIVYAVQANSLASNGRFDDAVRSSNNARNWILASVALFFVLWGGMFAMMLLAEIAGN